MHSRSTSYCPGSGICLTQSKAFANGVSDVAWEAAIADQIRELPTWLGTYGHDIDVYYLEYIFCQGAWSTLSPFGDNKRLVEVHNSIFGSKDGPKVETETIRDIVATTGTRNLVQTQTGRLVGILESANQAGIKASAVVQKAAPSDSGHNPALGTFISALGLLPPSSNPFASSNHSIPAAQGPVSSVQNPFSNPALSSNYLVGDFGGRQSKPNAPATSAMLHLAQAPKPHTTPSQVKDTSDAYISRQLYEAGGKRFGRLHDRQILLPKSIDLRSHILDDVEKASAMLPSSIQVGKVYSEQDEMQFIEPSSSVHHSKADLIRNDSTVDTMWKTYDLLLEWIEVMEQSGRVVKLLTFLLDRQESKKTERRRIREDKVKALLSQTNSEEDATSRSMKRRGSSTGSEALPKKR